MPTRTWEAVAAIACTAAMSPLHAATADERVLADLSLVELGNIKIISETKRAQRLSDAPSSVFVITANDIRRSGARTLPEALRLAPNLQVAQVSATEYAISARGFNGNSANKLLVLIDGRSVYTPLFSGVFWDVQDVVLEDVDRIEVVSGPGGTLWGVNAVNGVINVITRSAGKTPGGMIAAGAGNLQDRASVRYGVRTEGGGVDYRVFAVQDDFRHTQTQSGGDANDAGHRTLVGFRTDWAGEFDALSLHGDTYTGQRGQPLPGTISITGENFPLGPITTSGTDIVSFWEHHFAGGASGSVQGYYDRTQRTVVPTFEDAQDIYDLQLQYSAAPVGRHTITGGAGYRYGKDSVDNSIYVAFLPAQLDQTWVNVFMQDEVALIDDVQLTVGGRMERNDYTGWEFLPTLRLAWKMVPDQLLWAAASRTVRAPARLDHDTYVPYVPGQPGYLLRGGPDAVSETADDYELGYRGQLTPAASISSTVFHTAYDHLHTQEIDPSFTYLTFGNGMQGTVTGIEAWGTFQPAAYWRLHAGFTRLRQDLVLRPGSNDVAAPAAAEGANPAFWWSVRSSFDITAGSELDLTVRYVASLSDPDVPNYATLDLRYGWRPRRDLEVSIAGQNLTGGGHGEFTDVSTRSQIAREYFVKVDYRL